MSLKKLTEFSNVKEVMSDTHLAKTEIFETRFVKTTDSFVTLWKPDAAYETQDLESPGPRHRLTCHKDTWNYQRD